MRFSLGTAFLVWLLLPEPDVRPVPPPGIALSETERAALLAGLDELDREAGELLAQPDGSPAHEFLPDVLVYGKAVHDALAYDEVFDAAEIPVARSLVQAGLDRARRLRSGPPPWNEATGLVVRGYRSRIDGSIQPYGLVVPASWRPGTSHRYRLDCWFHGRGEKLSELSFIDQRQKSPGEFVPDGAIVLHLYGRYCNANKFAGEVDLFEALEDVKKRYPIDEDRIVVRGFSMGGAACWQFAVHYPGLWAAAAPGAGFAETAEFLKLSENEGPPLAPWERSLWHLYDATDYAGNLFNCPTVAYSGEIDPQKQAADVMARAMKEEGLELVHVIGPETAHKYHPRSKEEIDRRIDAIVARGREPVPAKVRFTTWTLRYDQVRWVRVDGLEKHWERARVDAEVVGSRELKAATRNVSGLTLSFSPGTSPFAARRRPTVVLDEQRLAGPRAGADRSWTAHFRKSDRRWTLVPSPDDGALRKRHGLQGPIDDAFMDSFIVVKPTGTPFGETVGGWAAKEMAHAIEHWRKQFRGDARVTTDEALTAEEIAAHNLVLWGDPSSNKVLARVLDRLPIRWDGKELVVGARRYPAQTHAPVLIYPNPLNRKRYVVINSGFTFREYDYLNNARQVPKLPDWAVVDVTTPPDSRWPGKVVAADFFDEEWKLK